MTTTPKKTRPNLGRKRTDLEGRVEPLHYARPRLGAVVFRRVNDPQRGIFHGNLLDLGRSRRHHTDDLAPDGHEARTTR